MIKKLLIAISTIAAMLAFASTSNAATSTVRLHTQGDVSKFLADPGTGVTSMMRNNSSDPAQKWIKTDTDSGYATYRNVKFPDRCLTGRGIQGFPVVTDEKCQAGSTRQQWRLGVSGDLQLRFNGLVAKHNLAGNGTGVVMSFFENRPEHKWHTHPA